MGGIMTGIQLQDRFTQPMLSLVGSVNLAVSAMEDMSRAVEADVDTSSIQGARDYLNQAAAAATAFNQELENMGAVPAERQPDPVQQDIQWRSDNMPVFTGTGMGRFQQEIQQTGEMLERLNDQQARIDIAASGLDILPANAVQDITGIRDRIHGIALAIQQLENNPVDIDAGRANSELERLRSQLSSAVAEQENLSHAMEGMDVSAINSSYMRLSQTIGNTERYIRDNITEQGNFNQEVERCRSPVRQVETGFKGWEKAIIVANNAIGLVKNTLGRIGITDLSGAFGRIDTMNRFQKTVSIMTGDSDMANAALAKLKDTTTGTAYGLDVASKATQGFLTRGMGLGAATEQVRIWADAVSFYGEGTNEQLESVVDAIGKMYSKGKVEADQLDRLFDAGIGAAEIYAKATGENVSKVKDDLSDGVISAAQFIDTVSRAMDAGVSAGAAKDAGSTWATTFANMGAAITRGWTNVITNLDNELSSRGLPTTMEMVSMFGQTVENILDNVGNSMGWIVDIAVGAGSAIGSAGSFITDNWGTIAPVIGAVAAAYLVYNGVLLAYNTIQGISNFLSAVSTARAAFHTGATFAEAAATTTATGAQVGFNAALLACPITWVIIAIIALIGVVIALANHFSVTGHTAKTAFGAICGAVNVANQFIKNLGLTVANFALGVWSAIGALCNNMNAAFHNSITSIQTFWYTLLATVLTVIAGICKELNKLPFIEFDYSGVTDQAEQYALKAQEAAGNKKDYESVGAAFNKGMNTFDTWQEGWADKAYKDGAKFGDGVTGKVKKYLTSKFKKGDDSKAEKEPKYPELPNTPLADTANNTAETAKNAKRAADALSITSEDLKYIRDMAEHDYINRFTTAQITVNQTNHNTVNSDMDLDGVVEYMRTTIEEQMDAAAEGVH